MSEKGNLATALLACALATIAFLTAVVRIAAGAEDAAGYRLATFYVDVTPPLGHPLIAGAVEPAKEIVDPLYARGFVLLGADEPIVFVAVDWCEIRNDAYERWRKLLAEAAKTSPKRVMVTSVHQHDAPIFDITAQKILDEHELKGAMCDPEFHERTVQRVAQGLRQSLSSSRRITHFGIGQAEVQEVASNRRVVLADGTISWNRGSFNRDPELAAAPVGAIDPWLKTLSFWDGDTPVLALSCYATHPMSYYGKGGVSSDFVGLARAKRQKEDPDVFQIYVSGCSGDVTAGKYNDQTPEGRKRLTERMHRAMLAAWKATERQPLNTVDYRVVPLELEPSNWGFYADETVDKTLGDATVKPFTRACAAMARSWKRRVAEKLAIDMPVIDLGKAHLLLMPAETFVEYQLRAQKMRPDSFVVTAGYGECAPGYIPTDKCSDEGFCNTDIWCWVAARPEAEMIKAMEQALEVLKDTAGK